MSNEVVLRGVLPSSEERRECPSTWQAGGKRALVPGSLLIVAGIVLISLAVRPDAGIFVLGGLVAIYVGYNWILSAATKRALRLNDSAPAGSTPADFLFNAAGYTTQSALGNSHMQWAAVAAVEETPKSFLFAMTPFFNLVLPKRFFDSEGHIAAFRDLVGQTGVRCAWSEPDVKP